VVQRGLAVHCDVNIGPTQASTHAARRPDCPRGTGASQSQ
jgi:hypothetical protein